MAGWDGKSVNAIIAGLAKEIGMGLISTNGSGVWILGLYIHTAPFTCPNTRGMGEIDQMLVEALADYCTVCMYTIVLSIHSVACLPWCPQTVTKRGMPASGMRAGPTDQPIEHLVFALPARLITSRASR